MPVENTSNKISGNFRAKVIDNNDTEKKGRIKVQVYPFFTDVEAAYLPWAVPAMPLFCGAGNNSGFFSVPKIGSWVWVFFENGDYNQPVFFAEAVTAVHGITVNAKTNYPNRTILKLNNIEVILDDTDGSITITSNQNITITANSNAVINTNGDTDITASGTVSISGSQINLN